MNERNMNEAVEKVKTRPIETVNSLSAAGKESRQRLGGGACWDKNYNCPRRESTRPPARTSFELTPSKIAQQCKG